MEPGFVKVKYNVKKMEASIGRTIYKIGDFVALLEDSQYLYELAIVGRMVNNDPVNWKDVHIRKLKAYGCTQPILLLKKFKRVDIIYCDEKYKSGILKTFPDIQFRDRDWRKNDETIFCLPRYMEPLDVKKLEEIPTENMTTLYFPMRDEYSPRNVLRILSYPFKEIHFQIEWHHYIFDYSIVREIIEVLLASPATHIHVKGLDMYWDDVVRLLEKPGIESLRVGLKEGYTESSAFDNNYTIKRFFAIIADGIYEVLPKYIYDRNTDGPRFKRTKVAPLIE